MLVSARSRLSALGLDVGEQVFFGGLGLWSVWTGTGLATQEKSSPFYINSCHLTSCVSVLFHGRTATRIFHVPPNLYIR